MPPRATACQAPIALAFQAILLLCTCLWGLAHAQGTLPSVLTDELLATPPGNVRTSATEDLFDHPLSNCTLRGPIENAQCNYEQVDAINDDFFTQLQAIVKTPYFRYYKTDLDKECPFWPANSFCTNENCAVQFLDQSDVPEKYRISTLSAVSTTPDEVVANLSGGTGASSCTCDEDNFCHWDDEYSPDAAFVDLQENPERFTGYAGPSAAQVWHSIYEENCFGVPGKAAGVPTRLSAGTPSQGIGFSSDMSFNPAASQAFASFLSAMQPEDVRRDTFGLETEGDVCLEKRVFYRIISGLHASISIHICADYLDTDTGEWGPNEPCFRSRIANFPERLQNLYFDYVLFLRALARVGEQAALQPNFTVTSIGNEIDDAASKAALDKLLSSATKLKPTFDERSMFSGPDAAGLREEFRHRFRNVTAVMDCVGCDKCRLWGKVQTNGVATALKILFAYDGQETSGTHRFLRRSELVALVNTANRLAESLKAVERFRTLYQQTLLADKKVMSDARTRPPPTVLGPPSPATSEADAPAGAAAQRQPSQPPERVLAHGDL